MDERIKVLDRRVGALEKTVARYAGIAALVGAAAGGFLPYLLKLGGS